MRKVIFVALMAATVLPGMAAAQTRELSRDRQDIREEQRELRHAQRYGDRHDVREERRDVREAKREYRQDWREYRRDHRDTYARGNWRSPNRYRSFNPGVRIEQRYYGSRYVIADPWRYRLPPARGNMRYVRHYDDVLLVNMRTGRVVDVYRNFFW
ncbi:RcnB family protein [Rhizorhapis suberifaciens]|uniref:Ni/Co efflux regulator RcnB n=1 Tax=Rhizorhapis suberifaciens TaxID=13656 RepID=A0A840HTI9_9SPHN|nr:RcnB family protein [Rhizorhapis suberifaciens]MBB4640929.1 Ni/Co efflux regulator RcnB [Rhizorhapis suberifaciens]